MPLIQIICLALGLAMDAFAVCLVAGSTGQTQGLRPAFRLSFHFALFQFIMPVLGWLAGSTIERLIRTYDHWIAFGLLGTCWRTHDLFRVSPQRGHTTLIHRVA